MGKRGNGYGSEDHFIRWRTERGNDLDSRLLQALGAPAGSTLEWVYPIGVPGEREPQGLRFLKDEPQALEEWKQFWPDTLRQQTWDGVARLSSPNARSEWVLIEAKANHPEFVTPPCAAEDENSLKLIESALAQTKKHLGVHRQFCWTGSYYQYANRLATLYFLNEIAQVPASLVHVYIYGDKFPDGRFCPAMESDWRELIRARDLTLGLPQSHSLSDRVHEVFLTALSAATPA